MAIRAMCRRRFVFLPAVERKLRIGKGNQPLANGGLCWIFAKRINRT
jgi:hypothetical protein